MAGRALVLALLLLAVVGLASAASAPALAPTNGVSAVSPSQSVSGSRNNIGNVEGSAVAAPIGGPVPDGVFTPLPTVAPSPTGGAVALQVSAIAGVVAAAAAIFF